MARPLRIQYPGAVYHLIARGNAPQRTLRDEEDPVVRRELEGKRAR